MPAPRSDTERPNRPSRLPEFAARRLVGRRDELARIGALLRERVRLLTLVGPPGVGKTRMALEAAREHETVAQVRPLWVPLGAHGTEDVVSTVAGLLGVSAATREPAVRIGEVLSGQGPLLLVLDDADALTAELPPLVQLWLDRAPALAVLITSRARLGIETETVVEVAPLPVADAVELFEVRSRAARRDRAATVSADVARSLALRLDCLPLAIEVAAARTTVLPPRKLLERLERHAGELLGSAAGGRHASLAAAIEVSWALLGDAERTTLRRCAAFSGTFSLEAAEAVVAGGNTGWSVLDAIAMLHERSLLERIEPSSLEGEVRFYLYSSVRAFSLARLEEAGERESIEQRVDEVVVGECERLVRQLESGGAHDAEERLELEREQLVATHKRCVDSRSPSGLATRLAIGVRAGLALAELSALRGVSSTALHETTLRAARACDDVALLARSLIAFAVAAGRLGWVDEPARALDEAIARCEATGEAAMLGRALLARGRYRAQHGAFDEADADLARAEALDATRDDAWVAGCVRNVAGCVAEIRGEFDAAVRAFEAARACFRRCGNERMEAAVLNNLGVVRQAEGRGEDSRELFEAALARASASDNRIIEADAHMNLGSWHLGEGDLEAAERHSRVGLALQKRLGNRRFEGVALMNLAMAAHERGELRVARDRYQEALATLRECGEARFVAMGLPFAAAAEASLGLVHEAKTDFEAARRAPPGMDPGHDLVVDTLEAFLHLAEARGADPERRAAAEQRAAELHARARDLLDRDRRAPRRPELALATRLLARTFGPAESRPPGISTPAPPPAGDGVVVVGGGERWFSFGGPPVDLSRRANLRLILRALVEHRQDAPGIGLSPERLFDAGWPGQKAQPQAAAARVYTAVNTLRRLGLDPVLVRHDDGYLIDPAVVIRRA